MDYEKKYKDALARAKELCDVADTFTLTIHDIITIFPELQESEDERIRKEILNVFKQLNEGTTICGRNYDYAKWIAWLEKQDEKKSADKVESKFYPGDWVILNGIVAKILDKQKYGFVGLDIDGKDFFCNYGHTDSMRLWTIEDAKDGDVLMTTKTRNCPFIYRKTDYNNNLAYYYAGVDGNGDFCEGCLKRTIYHFGSVSNVVPATKEQRDLLFQKMKEAGYEWDSEKKELKKIEVKTLDANKVIE